MKVTMCNEVDGLYNFTFKHMTTDEPIDVQMPKKWSMDEYTYVFDDGDVMEVIGTETQFILAGEIGSSVICVFFGLEEGVASPIQCYVKDKTKEADNVSAS